MILHVTSHPARRASRAGLLPGFECRYVEDDGRGLVANTLRTLRAAAGCPGEWALRAEDDVECGADLAGRVPGLLASSPADAVLLALCSLYPAPPGAVGWVPLAPAWTFHTYLMAVRAGAVEGLAAGVVEASRHHPAGRKREWDRFLTDWISRAGVPAYVLFPSAAQHVGRESLIGHRWGPHAESPTYERRLTAGPRGA